MENKAEKIFSDLKEEISTYAGLRLRLWKLMAIERTAGMLASLSLGLILTLFAFFTILFLFVALGFFLGDWLGSIALGFLLVGMIYLVLTFAFVLAEGRIRMRLTNVFVKALQANDEEDQNEDKDKTTDSARPALGRETGTPASVPGDGKED
ncbi:MAG: phage holin family protein [Odoribacter sp.]|nr:phage holin family protein [Odoribacter sp.]